MDADVDALTELERIALHGLHARAQLMQQSIDRDEQMVWGAIELRIGLSHGAIGTTHQIDFASSSVVAAVTPQTR